VNRSDYSWEATEGALSILLEVVSCLGRYRDGIAVVGGFVPHLHLEDHVPRQCHIGTLDVDLALDPGRISRTGYATIVEILEGRGFEQRASRLGEPIPHSFSKDYRSPAGNAFPVTVDFLAPWIDPPRKRQRHQRVQDLLARGNWGCNLVFDHCVLKRIEGFLPNGARHSREVLVADVAPFLVMKAGALKDRRKDKDAYDIYMMLRYHPYGGDGIAARLAEMCEHPLVREALEILGDWFASPGTLGPVAVADFLEEREEPAREIQLRDACERVRSLLEHVRKGGR